MQKQLTRNPTTPFLAAQAQPFAWHRQVALPGAAVELFGDTQSLQSFGSCVMHTGGGRPDHCGVEATWTCRCYGWVEPVGTRCYNKTLLAFGSHFSRVIVTEQSGVQQSQYRNVVLATAQPVQQQ
jgi:hypothetical protein